MIDALKEQSNLTLASRGDNASVRAACFRRCIEPDERRGLILSLAALWRESAATAGWAEGGIVGRIPHGVVVGRRPEHVVLDVEDVLLGDVRLSEHGVTLAEIALARAEIVLAHGITVLVSIAILDELANACVAVFHAGALETILVRFAHSVQSINWWTMAWVGHWAVTKNQTIAAIGPVLALVELAVVMAHHIDQL